MTPRTRLGQLWKPVRLRSPVEEAGAERHATWLELFYDLVFVVAVAELGHNLSGDLTVLGGLKFVGLFVPLWWAWVGHTFYADRFDTDDTTHRLLTILQMFAIAALAASSPSEKHGWRVFGGMMGPVQ